SSHKHSVIRSDSKKGNKSNPYSHTQINRTHLEQVPHISSRNAEVHKPWLPVKPDHDESAGKSHKHSGKVDRRSDDSLKLEVQQQENDDQRNRNNNRQPLHRPHLILIIS